MDVWYDTQLDQMITVDTEIVSSDHVAVRYQNTGYITFLTNFNHLIKMGIYVRIGEL
jgi:hypothetical protein